jgi:hypothetical protein
MASSKLRQQKRLYPLGALVSQSTFNVLRGEKTFEMGVVIDYLEDDFGIWLVVLADNKVSHWRCFGNAISVMQKPYCKIKM